MSSVSPENSCIRVKDKDKAINVQYHLLRKLLNLIVCMYMFQSLK